MSCRARYCLLALALTWGAAAACDDAASAGAGDAAAADLTPDFASPDPGPDSAVASDVGPLGAPSLDFVTAVGSDGEACRGSGYCAVFMTPAGTPRLEVVVSEGGVPVAERVVTFKIEGDDAGIGQISRLSTYSDLEGRAWVEVSAPGATLGQFRVRAQLGASVASPVTFDVVVTPDGRVPLTVRPSYDGELKLSSVSVRAFAQAGAAGPRCDDPAGLLAATAPTAVVDDLEPGRPARFLTLAASPPGTRFTVLAAGENDAGLVVALGCDANQAQVDAGQTVSVAVPMGDRSPGFSGAFDTTARLSVADALSGPWGPRTEAAFGVLDGDPGALALLPCTLAAAEPSLAELCALLFNDPKAPHPDDATLLGKAVLGAIAGHVTALRQGQPWGAALAGGGSTRGALSGLEIRSTVTFATEPSASGSWTAAEAGDVWDAVVVRFAPVVPCEGSAELAACKKKLFFATTQPDAPVGGGFDATVTHSLALSFQSHPVGLRYGHMLDAVLERALLPALLGTAAGGGAVSRWEDLIALALGGPGCLDKTGSGGCCAKFVASAGGLLALGSGSGTAACEAWITASAESLRAPLLEAGGDGSGFANLGTQAPCPAFDDDRDLVVDRFGSIDATCPFDLVVGDGDGSTTMSLGVYGVRAP